LSTGEWPSRACGAAALVEGGGGLVILSKEKSGGQLGQAGPNDLVSQMLDGLALKRNKGKRFRASIIGSNGLQNPFKFKNKVLSSKSRDLNIFKLNLN
jgi:hypothetical protein